MRQNSRSMKTVSVRMIEIRNMRKNIRTKMRRTASGGCKKIVRLRSGKRYLGRDGVCSGSASKKSLPSSIKSRSGTESIPTTFMLFVHWPIHHDAIQIQNICVVNNADKEKKRKRNELSFLRQLKIVSSVVC